MELTPFIPPNLDFFRDLELLAEAEKMKQKKKEELKELMKRKNILVNKDLIAIPRNFLECETTFFLYGEIVVSTNYQDDMKSLQERSSLTKFCKPVLRQEYKKNIRIIEQQLGTSMVGLHNYEHVLQLLISKGDSLLYSVGYWLEQQKKQFSLYRDSFRKIHTQKKNEGTLEEYLQFTNTRFQSSLAWSYDYMAKIQPNVFYDFKIGRINYETLNFEIVVSGVSEAFISLLGTTVYDFQQITQRRGRQVLMTAKSRLDILIAELKGMSIDQCVCPEPVEIDLLSFDGLKIPCTAVYQHIHPNQHLHVNKYDEVLILREFVVSENIIAQLMNSRNQTAMNNNSSSLNGSSFHASEDFEYSAESMVFLQKFYPHIASKLEC